MEYILGIYGLYCKIYINTECDGSEQIFAPWECTESHGSLLEWHGKARDGKGWFGICTCLLKKMVRDWARVRHDILANKKYFH